MIKRIVRKDGTIRYDGAVFTITPSLCPSGTGSVVGKGVYLVELPDDPYSLCRRLLLFRDGLCREFLGAADARIPLTGDADVGDVDEGGSE